MERKIGWEKWVNPLTGAGADKEPEFDEKEAELPFRDSVEEEFQQLLELRKPPVYKPVLGRVIAGPMGLIPVDEHGDPAVVYNFWLAHTNFEITDEVEAIGSTVPGVESWDTFSRYRARVSFGKMFNETDVKRNIWRALGCGVGHVAAQPQPSPRQRLMGRLKASLAARAEAWAILESSDGQLKTVFGSAADVSEAIKLHKEHKLLSSWEDDEQIRKINS